MHPHARCTHSAVSDALRYGAQCSRSGTLLTRRKGYRRWESRRGCAGRWWALYGRRCWGGSSFGLRDTVFLVVPSVAARRNRRKRVHEVAPAAEVWGLLASTLRPTEMAPNARDDLGEHCGGVGMATRSMDKSESDNVQLHMTSTRMGSNIDFCFQDGSYEYTGHKTDFHAYLGIFGSTGSPRS